MKLLQLFQFPRLSSTPSAPDTNYNYLYFKGDDLYSQNPSGAETKISSYSTSDSGWITVGSGGTAPSYASGWSDANTGSDYRTRFRKVGSLVTLQVSVTKASGAGSTIFNLPTGYRPSVPLQQALFSTYASYQATQGLQVNTNGDVAVTASGLAVAPYWGSVTFPV